MNAGSETDLSVLLIDDNELVAKAYVRRLTDLEPTWRFGVESQAERGREALLSGTYDVALVDLVLRHELSGLDLCSDARCAGVSTSVIVLSVEESDAARLSAIDAGADDYVPKTTSIQELRARILLAHKRPRLRPSQSPVLSDKERALSAAEHRFLDLLRTRGEVTLASAAEVVLGRRDAGSIRALYKVVDKVRRKLGRDGEMIQSVRGRGYRWNVGNAKANKSEHPTANGLIEA